MIARRLGAGTPPHADVRIDLKVLKGYLACFPHCLEVALMTKGDAKHKVAHVWLVSGHCRSRPGPPHAIGAAGAIGAVSDHRQAADESRRAANTLRQRQQVRLDESAERACATPAPRAFALLVQAGGRTRLTDIWHK